MGQTISLIIFVAVFGSIGWIFYRKAADKTVLPPVLPQEGVNIPVINAYQGWRFFNVHNGLWTSLRLFEDHFEFRIFTKKSFNFGDVKEVTVNSGVLGGATSVIISFNNGAWNYRAFMNKHNRREVLNYFKTKGCNLTPEAQAVLSQAV